MERERGQEREIQRKQMREEVTLSSDDNYIHDETLIIQKSLSTNDVDTPCERNHFVEYNRPKKHQIF